MIVVTTPTVDGHRTVRTLGFVSGDTILGANIFKDFLASVRDVVGGRSGAWEKELIKAKKMAIAEMIEEAHQLGGNAVVGVDLDFESLRTGSGAGGMLMVNACGTAVIIEE